MGLSPTFNPWILFLFLSTSIPFSSSQPTAPPPSSQDSDLCNGVFISYTYTTGIEIKPKNTTNQPYRFESVLTVLNNGQDELKSWRVFVGFDHREILVSATNAVLFDGSTLPVSVENGTIFAGYPVSDLKSAIMTAGDITQMQARVELVGTQFGVASPNVPLPNNISLVNDGWDCPKATQRGRNVLQVCCTPLPLNKTKDINNKYLPRQQGDLTIMYDITRTYQSSYWSQVTIENHNPLGRLDNWKLSFQWMKDEFIFATKGAYPNIIDSSDCINGPQGKYYQDLDFSNVLTCARKPTIIDLPLTKFNDSTLGLIPFCCRNGTILPKPMDPTKSKSVFEMQVFKMPPNLNISDVSPPLNWEITGNHYNPEYKCGLPLQVTPSQFPDLTGLPSNRTAFASWQIVCNITQPKTPKCCVSFSSYFNDSIIPCKTCACGGCSSDDEITRSCSTNSPALFLPPQALLIPFDNRTKLTTTWANLKHRQVPDPLPCGDNCGVSINWHLATDYRGGWTARVTLFNWGETNFADWFTAVELRNAVPGFEKAYSFNGSIVSINGNNNTILMEGLPGLNYLVAQTEPENPEKDFPIPGKQQSVISFTKKLTPKINVGAGDGFPTKVFFNGQECSLPSVLPTSNSYKRYTSLLIAVPFLAFLILRL